VRSGGLQGSMGDDAVAETSRSGPAHRALLVAVVALVTVAFAPTLLELAAKWSTRPESSHGFLMPFVAGWMVWDRRAELAALAPRASLLGALLLVPCVAVLLIGEVAVFEVVKPFAFVGSLGAIVWALYGLPAVRVLLAPFAALLLMCPPPYSLVNALTVPLKGSAALIATGLLDLTGVRATLDGNVIVLPGLEKLFVADACSGINSLVSLTSVALIVCLVWRRHWAVGLAVVLACVPIAILTNGLRIWMTGLLSVKSGPEAAQGFFHSFQGMALFGAGLVLLWGWTALLARAFPGGGE